MTLFFTADELTQNGIMLVLCHYPFRSWNGQHRRSINLHGHSHGKLKPLLRQFDVGIDARNYRPTTLDQLIGRTSPEGTAAGDPATISTPSKS